MNETIVCKTRHPRPTRDGAYTLEVDGQVVGVVEHKSVFYSVDVECNVVKQDDQIDPC